MIFIVIIFWAKLPSPTFRYVKNCWFSKSTCLLVVLSVLIMSCIMWHVSHRNVFLCSVKDNPAPEAVIWSVMTLAVKIREIVRHYIFFILCKSNGTFCIMTGRNNTYLMGFTWWFWFADIVMGYGPCPVLQTVGYCALSGPVVFCQVWITNVFFMT